MQDKVYCGQCGTENPTPNKFCGQCGNKLEYIATTPIDYEYQYFEWRVSSDIEPDCVFAREGWPASDPAITLRQMTEAQARVHFWQKYQKYILEDFQKWQDVGWRPITEVSASCVELEKSSSRDTSFLIGLVKALFMEKWCFVGATIQVRRPKKQ